MEFDPVGGAFHAGIDAPLMAGHDFMQLQLRTLPEVVGLPGAGLQTQGLKATGCVWQAPEGMALLLEPVSELIDHLPPHIQQREVGTHCRQTHPQGRRVG